MSPRGLVQIAAVPRKAIRPVLLATERRAYQAAWRILLAQEDVSVNDFACAATRRSRLVDRMAALIQEEMTAGGTLR